MSFKNILKVHLTNHWFDEIKSGRKNHEYRECKGYWYKRIFEKMSFKQCLFNKYKYIPVDESFIEFTRAFYKNAETMLFRIDYIKIMDGKNTDLKCQGNVFDIKLGERIK